MQGLCDHEELYSLVVANNIAEHAVKWYQDKVRESLLEHAGLELELGKAVDYSIPAEQAAYDESDPVCKIVGPEIEWWAVRRPVPIVAYRLDAETL